MECVAFKDNGKALACLHRWLAWLKSVRNLGELLRSDILCTFKGVWRHKRINHSRAWTVQRVPEVKFRYACTCMRFICVLQACGCCPVRNSNIYSSLWILFTSSTFWFSTNVAVPAFLILWFRLGRCSENQLETVMARRSRPRLTQCTSEVTGMSEKSARSRHMGALLHSKSLTMLRISWRSAWRIIPRMFSKVETCFFLWEGGWTEEDGEMLLHILWWNVISVEFWLLFHSVITRSEWLW